MLLSEHEAIVWWEFHHNMATGEIAEAYKTGRRAPEYVYELLIQKRQTGRSSLDSVSLKDPGYVSRVLNRARVKIEKALREHARSHRLQIESVQDYKGLLIGFDYQANAQVYIAYTMRDGVIVWYKHDSWAGKLCAECPKRQECRSTLDTIMAEYDIHLRPDEEELYMTQQSIAIFHRLAAKDTPRYKRK